MLVDMMRNFNASLERMNEIIEKSTQEIAQTNQRVETLSTQVVGEGRIINNEQPRGVMRNFPIDKDRDLKLLELPEFTGDGDAEDFLDWVLQMEKVFDYKGFDEQKAYKVANLKLTRYASLWLAERFEKQEKEKKTSYFKERKSFFNGEGSNINSNNSNNKGKMIVVTPEQAALAKKVCFKCQRMEHIARDCGNKVTVSKKEHRMLLAYLDQEEKEKESTCFLNTEEEFDFEEFEGQEKITHEPEHHHI
uniref:CCHC-type domain-containing protein n=1 Tax=Chenopodium quinoa TaxID=63459 RepID=A0A803MCA0_CHEQI